MVTGLCVVQFCQQSYSRLTNQTTASLWSDLVHYLYDYRLNWTPLSPITIIYRRTPVSVMQKKKKKKEMDTRKKSDNDNKN